MKVPSKIVKARQSWDCYGVSHITLWFAELFIRNAKSKCNLVLDKKQELLSMICLKTWPLGKHYEKKQKCLPYILQTSKIIYQGNNRNKKVVIWEGIFFSFVILSITNDLQFPFKNNRSRLPLKSFSKVQTATSWDSGPLANICSKRALSKAVC